LIRVAPAKSSPEALHEDVSARDQAPEDLEPAVRLEIQGEALLVAVHRHERGALVTPIRRGPRAGVVAPSRAFHLDDLGPHVAEDLRAEGAGDILCEVRDDDPF
jgi:hypothetical protein